MRSSDESLGCASEPIHVPGSIGPHGVLLALEERSLRIIAASANAGRLLGVDGELQGQPLARFIDANQLVPLTSGAMESTGRGQFLPFSLRGGNSWVMVLRTGGQGH